jgi:hypothetical protein
MMGFGFIFLLLFIGFIAFLFGWRPAGGQRMLVDMRILPWKS